MDKKKSFRAFISIEIPETIKSEIIKIQKSLPSFNGKFTKVENLHLTLKFLGETGEKTIEDVKNLLKKVKSPIFKTKISDVGAFSKKEIRIIWAKMDNCENLQHDIDSVLSGIIKKEKRFMGHVTIARVKTVKDKEEFLSKIKKIKVPSDLNFEVRKFNLKESTLTTKGPIYETLEEYSLV